MFFSIGSNTHQSLGLFAERQSLVGRHPMPWADDHAERNDGTGFHRRAREHRRALADESVVQAGVVVDRDVVVEVRARDPDVLSDPTVTADDRLIDLRALTWK